MSRHNVACVAAKLSYRIMADECICAWPLREQWLLTGLARLVPQDGRGAVPQDDA